MALPRIAAIVLMLALTVGCGGDAVTARTPAEAVAQRMKGSTGVKVARLVRLDYGENVFTPPAEDDFIVPVNIGEYSESRTAGVLSAAASDLTTTYYQTNVPDELKSVFPTDLSYMTTRAISIAGSGTYRYRADRQDVPAGKSWLHSRSSGCEQRLRAIGSLGVLDLVSPEVLRKLAAPVPSAGEAIDGVATVVHAGSSSQAEFGIAAPHDDPVLAAQLLKRLGSIQVSWQLWVGPDRLPRRVRLTFTHPMAEDNQPKTAVAEVDFTDWGSDVLIDSPPPDQVHETGTCLDPEPY
ncbi:hypothetical protein GCM10009555_083460 [Acrocarpospora macrocephala]|uniref:Lipoprotein n=1 Tax=Acrocarpospora macrocephala TaxID=150177 RepID=A0A5M3X0P5_9ACTN|nr:hypothetical protein [Acrocarpospora macrocephala]GES15335.1 hypothetical protein Amac_089320 [Acrocarpospora macrocephala]